MPQWINNLSPALIGLILGAQGMSIYIGRDDVALLDALMTPLSVILAALAVILTVRQLIESHRQGPASHRRRRWTSGALILAIFIPIGAFAFHRASIYLRETRDIFEIHHETWATPCTETEGPKIFKDRIGGDKLRFLCRYKSDSLAAEVFTTEYQSRESRDSSRPVDDPQVEVLEQGEWNGPKSTEGTYIKFRFRDESGTRYARYWLEDKDDFVSIIASVDIYRKVSDADFVVPRQSLLAKRYRLTTT